MNQFYEVTAVSAHQEELQCVAEKYGVKSHCVEMTRTISPFKDIAAVWNLYQFLRKEKPFIVHSHTPKAGIVGMMAAWFAGVPNRFHTVAGLPLLETEGSKRRLLNIIERLTYRFATKVYPNSFQLQSIIMKYHFCFVDKLKVIGKGSSNGIDTAYFNPDQISATEQNLLKQKLGITENDFAFIFVGRLVKDKGINELVAAFKILSGKKRLSSTQQFQPKLLLVGPLEHQLDPLDLETLKEIETNPHIVSVGFQEEVRPYFAISDALVFPSYREGFPNVVLQAGSMGLPSIVSDINGCNEIIKHGCNGLIVPAKDADSLQSSMQKLLTDPVLYQTLKSKTQEHILPYEQKAVWEAILAEYRALGQE